MLSNEDLAALLPRVALGDRAAFERVYRATCAHVLGVAFRILNSRERAEEVLQEAFMDVWHSAGGFDAPKNAAKRAIGAKSSGKLRHSAHPSVQRPAIQRSISSISRGSFP